MTEQRKQLCLEGTVFRLLRSPQPTIGCFVRARKEPSHPFAPEFLSICLEISRTVRARLARKLGTVTNRPQERSDLKLGTTALT